MATKKKLTRVVTPVGKLMYLNIDGPGKEKYDADKGNEYVATIWLTGDESVDLRASMDKEVGEIRDDEVLKSAGYRQLMEDSEGNVFTPTKKNVAKQKTGKLIDLYSFTFKTGTEYADGKVKKIKVFDTVPKEVNLKGKKIGNGSIGAISGNMERTVYKGEVSCSMYLNAIQLTKFIPYTEDTGFGAQEGDFDGNVEDEETGFVGSSADDEAEDEIPTDFEAGKGKSKAKPRI